MVAIFNVLNPQKLAPDPHLEHVGDLAHVQVFEQLERVLKAHPKALVVVQGLELRLPLHLLLRLLRGLSRFFFHLNLRVVEHWVPFSLK